MDVVVDYHEQDIFESLGNDTVTSSNRSAPQGGQACAGDCLARDGKSEREVQ